jgi:hypothetical protein
VEDDVDRLTWSTAVRALVGILVAGFVAGAVLLLVLSFDVLGAPPEPSEDFIERTVAGFEFQATRWPVEFAANALFAIGFVALALLGPTLARLADAADARRGLLSASFLLGGGLGLAAQLVWLGAKPVAASPQYCDCGLLAEEIMSRLMALDIVSAIQGWLVHGAVIAIAIGLALVVPLGRWAGMPAAWGVLTYVTAAVALLTEALGVVGASPFDLIGTVIVTVILIPAWAVWLAMRADDLSGEGAAGPL